MDKMTDDKINKKRKKEKTLLDGVPPLKQKSRITDIRIDEIDDDFRFNMIYDRLQQIEAKLDLVLAPKIRTPKVTYATLILEYLTDKQSICTPIEISEGIYATKKILVPNTTVGSVLFKLEMQNKVLKMARGLWKIK